MAMLRDAVRRLWRRTPAEIGEIAHPNDAVRRITAPNDKWNRLVAAVERVTVFNLQEFDTVVWPMMRKEAQDIVGTEDWDRDEFMRRWRSLSVTQRKCFALWKGGMRRINFIAAEVGISSEVARSSLVAAFAELRHAHQSAPKDQISV